jgi:hypothetical protein
MTDKDQFISTVHTYISRNGIEDLLEMLERTDFYIAPASTRFHDSVEGGLCHHSLKVFDEMLKNAYRDVKVLSVAERESIAIVSLFHDLCKIGFYVSTWKNVKQYSEDGDKRDEGGRFKWVVQKGYDVDDKFPYGHGEKSVFMLHDFITLTADEALAIRWHMGGFEPRENHQYLSNAFGQCPLAVQLHIADLSATYL